jgi:hypothetical protein
MTPAGELSKISKITTSNTDFNKPVYSAEWVRQDDIKDMLLFYDFITHLIDDLFEYSQYLSRTE